MATAERASAIAASMAEAWNTRDLGAFLDHLTDDVVWNDPAMSVPARGRHAVSTFSQAVLRAFPDFYYRIRPPVCAAPDASRCAVPWRISGTHLGRLDPPGYGPTGRRAVFEGVDLLEFRGERVCRIDTYFNVLIPGEQLLALRLRPAPGSWRERVAVWAQRARAAWVRRRRFRDDSHGIERHRGGQRAGGPSPLDR